MTEIVLCDFRKARELRKPVSAKETEHPEIVVSIGERVQGELFPVAA